MSAPDIERLLRRRLYLQRYVSALDEELTALAEPGDARLLAALGDFLGRADARALGALGRARRTHPLVRELHAQIAAVLGEQRAATLALIAEALPDLAARELRVTAEAISLAAVPSARGLATEPADGSPPAVLLGAALALYARRLNAEIVRAATSETPEAMLSLVRGSGALRQRDGLLHWRRTRLLRPNVDLIVNATASNAARRAYRLARVELVDHLATLDYRTCPRCRAAEAGGPYRLGTEPGPTLHPRCRCLSIPAGYLAEIVRPFVADARPVKDIPKGERAGKIGRTRLSIEQFFARMSAEDRRAYLGPTLAARWERGVVTDIRDLVDARTLAPLRLDQIPER